MTTIEAGRTLRERAAGLLSPFGAENAPDLTLPPQRIVELIRKGAISRLAFSVLISLIATSVAPPVYLAAWCALIGVWELLVRDALEDWLVLKRRSPGAEIWLAAINLLGACFYAVVPIVAWASGLPLGMMLATAWVCGTANHGFVYFSGNRLLLASVIAPPVAVSLTVPFVTGGFTVASAVAAVTLVLCVAIAGLFGRDRRLLAQALTTERSARSVAENANASKSQFLATVSHELRTPLNAVIGYSELIEEETTGAIAEDARKIREAARGLLGQINTVLEISRLEAGDVALQSAPADLAALLHDIESAARPLAMANGNTLTLTLASGMGQGRVDAAQFTRCLMQLASNAAKFTKDGAITLTATRFPQDGAEWLSVEVRDTGVGIPHEQQAKIFEPFMQAESGATRRAEGAGLGLSHARLMARLMGGDITCQSTPGRGTTFTLKVRLG